MTTLIIIVITAALTASAAIAGAPTKTFFNPTYGRYPVDFCVYWSKACGKPAANRYCSGRSYEGAVKFTKSPRSPTKLQGTGQICEGPRCATFSSITCYVHGL